MHIAYNEKTSVFQKLFPSLFSKKSPHSHTIYEKQTQKLYIPWKLEELTLKIQNGMERMSTEVDIHQGKHANKGGSS